MNISSEHLTTNLRMLDTENSHIRTLSRIRPGINNDSVMQLFIGFNRIMQNQATSAVVTSQRELLSE